MERGGEGELRLNCVLKNNYSSILNDSLVIFWTVFTSVPTTLTSIAGPRRLIKAKRKGYNADILATTPYDSTSRGRVFHGGKE